MYLCNKKWIRLYQIGNMKPAIDQNNVDLDPLVPVPKIFNMCSSFAVDNPSDINLQEVASRFGNSQYNPKKFNAAIMRTKSPKSTVLIFRTGKIVIVGTQAESDSLLVARKVLKKLSKLGFCHNKMKKQLQINNIVGSASVHFRINIESMNSIEGTHYEPDSFPALIYRMKNPKSTFLVFTNGKIVINGAKSQQDLFESFAIFFRLLKRFRVLPKQKRKVYDRKQFLLI